MFITKTLHCTQVLIKKCPSIQLTSARYYAPTKRSRYNQEIGYEPIITPNTRAKLKRLLLTTTLLSIHMIRVMSNVNASRITHIMNMIAFFAQGPMLSVYLPFKFSMKKYFKYEGVCSTERLKSKQLLNIYSNSTNGSKRVIKAPYSYFLAAFDKALTHILILENE
uniref:Uncharacterized protein n=1 Tax=Glossina austeni TaxID=7395 RepID=A0A1A9VAP2_GLOAU